MFSLPFSFNGRITRTEYGLSMIFYILIYFLLSSFIESDPDNAVAALLIIPMIWFLWAQGAKRCHDVGTSGWMQVVPFYVLWMIFQAGTRGENEYGDDPKGNGEQIAVPITTVQSEITNARETPAVSNVSTSSDEPIQIRIEHVTVLEVLNINYSLVQDVLKSLRSLDLINHLSYDFMDTTAKITVNHKNTSQALLDKLYTIMENIEVLGVKEGLLKIKLN